MKCEAFHQADKFLSMSEINLVIYRYLLRPQMCDSTVEYPAKKNIAVRKVSHLNTSGIALPWIGLGDLLLPRFYLGTKTRTSM